MTLTDETRTETVHATWEGGLAGVGSIQLNGLCCTVSAPTGIGGSGTGESPSSLLVAGASGCFLLTLAGLLEQHGVHVMRISIETDGVYGRAVPPDLCAIIHRPRVVVHHRDVGRVGVVRECFQTAKKTCVAARAMGGVDITVDGTTYVEFSDDSS